MTSKPEVEQIKTPTIEELKEKDSTWKQQKTCIDCLAPYTNAVVGLRDITKPDGDPIILLVCKKHYKKSIREG